MKTLILTQRDVASILTMEAAVPAVERAFAAHGRGEAIMPAKVYLPLEDFGGDFRAMPAYFEGSAGVKWVNSHPGNPAKHGLPAVRGVFILSDPATAAPLAVMDATLLTAYRTGAAGAVASRALGKKAPKTLGLIGSGVQARVLLSAHRVVFQGLEVLCADKQADVAQRFAQQLGGRAVSLEEASACDIICTATPSRAPIVMREWVKPGTHINAMGADAEGKQELESALTASARIVVDDPAQALHSGEVNVPLHHGALTEDAIVGGLGAVLAGRVTARTSDSDITLFDSTGLAVQDLAVARVIVAKAKKAGVGVALNLVG